EVLPPTLMVSQPYLTLNQMMAADDEQKLRQLEARFKQEADAYRAAHERWSQELTEGALREELIVRAYIPAQEVLRLGRDEYLPALNAGDKDKARRVLYNMIDPAFEAHYKIVSNAGGAVKEEVAASEQAALRRMRAWLIALTVISIAAVLVIVAAGIWLTRG